MLDNYNSYTVTLVNDYEIKIITTLAQDIETANYLAYEQFSDLYDQVIVEERESKYEM